MTHLYICRWTNRKIHKNFIKTLQQDWRQYPDVKLHVAVHGVNDIDPEVKEALAIGNIHEVVDFRDATNGTQQGLFSWKCHEHAIYSDCDNYGIVDDDAFFSDPMHTIGKVNEVLDRDLMGGATGPFDNYRMFSKYRDRDPSIEFQPMVWSPWTTTGVQFYKRRATAECGLIIKEFLTQLNSNVDYPTWLTLWYFGYTITEFHDLTFKHVCSNGDRGYRDQKWYMKRIHDGLRNQQVIRKVFETYPRDRGDFKELMRRTEVIERNRINRTIKDGQEIEGHKEWDIPLLKHFDERWAYYNANLKGRPELEILN